MGVVSWPPPEVGVRSQVVRLVLLNVELLKP